MFLAALAVLCGLASPAAATNPRGPEPSIERLYQSYFDRQPDADGLRFWVSELASGRSLLSIAEQFGQSPEFVDTYGSLSNTEFVDLIYMNVLGRPGEASGRTFWIGQLDAQMQTRAQVMTNFSESPEFVLDFSVDREQLVRLYQAYFLRPSDEAGLRFWVDRHVEGMDLGSISAQFAASPEFIDRYGRLDDRAFLVQIYENVFDRQPDDGGLTFWLGRLESGAIDRGRLMLEFSESDEFIDKMTTPPAPEPEPEPDGPCTLTDRPDVRAGDLQESGDASITVIRFPVDCEGRQLADFIGGTDGGALITSTITVGDEIVYEIVDMAERDVPPFEVVDIPSRLIGDNLALDIAMDVSYRTAGSDTLGSGSFRWSDDLAVQATISIEHGATVEEPDVVDTVTVTGALPDGVTSRQARFEVRNAAECAVIAPLTQDEVSATVFDGTVGQTFEFSFDVEVTGQCRMNLTSVFGVMLAPQMIEIEVVTMAPTDVRLESSSCTEFGCTAVFSAVRQSEIDHLVEFTGFSDQDLVANVRTFFGRVGTAEVGERVVVEHPELNRVDSFCFSARSTSGSWKRGRASEVRCADLVGDEYVERAVGDELLPLARNDQAAIQAGGTVLIDWWNNDRVNGATVTSISEESLLGGTIDTNGSQLTFTAGTPGTASFDYTICDESEPTPACSTATVSIEVTACDLPPLRYSWDVIQEANTGTGWPSGEFVDCNGQSLAFQDVTMSGAVGFDRSVYASAENVDAVSFAGELGVLGVPLRANGTLPIQGWYSYQLEDGTVVGRGAIDEVVEIPVEVAYTAVVDQTLIFENGQRPTMTVAGTLGGGVASREIQVDVVGCRPQISLGESPHGGWVAFRGRVDADFSIAIPLTAQPCGASLEVRDAQLSYVTPPLAAFSVEVVPQAPQFPSIQTTDCVDGQCAVTFSATRFSAFSTEVVVVGWSADGAEWNTISEFGTPTIAALREQTVNTTATFSETSSFCAATRADWFTPPDRPIGYGELFCADLIDGVYVQRAPTAAETSLYAG